MVASTSPQPSPGSGKRVRMLFYPGIAQSHRPVENRCAGFRIFQVRDEITVALELETLLGLRLPDRRFAIGMDEGLGVRIDVGEEVAFRSGVSHREQAVVEPHFGFVS